MSSIIGAGGDFATNIKKGNVLGSISSGLALVNQLDSFLNDSDIDEKKEEANAKFQEAVESFKKSVKDFTLGQKISFAKLEQIQFQNQGTKTFKDWRGRDKVVEDWTNLVSYGSGGGGSVLGGKDPSNAKLDTSKLKQELNQAGYTDLAKQVDSIFGGYAKYEEESGKWGKNKSYISGYGMRRGAGQNTSRTFNHK